ncbi:F11 receptor, tandem duplicate 1 [Oreochromis aureus]|uniref:Junctional adhesion molecule A n=1 Tax=Oreochromis aureus TaxID=47969 RepID=A0A668UD22_OREAU|nr:F11 receptor, tandem duplicate 1 [Oreochromis aureus]
MTVRGVLWLLLFSGAAIGVSGYTVTTSNANVQVEENKGVDLTCAHSGDFGSNVLLRWKFKDRKGSQVFVVHDGKPTAPYANRLTVYGGSNLRFTTVTRKDTGVYTCEITSSDKTQVGETNVNLTVLVPPSVPYCIVPSSVTTGRTATMSCSDESASPPPTYRWYKNNVLLPDNPSNVAGFKNATYRLNPKTGILEFPAAAKTDTADYYCESVNSAGPAQRCRAMKMEVRDLNTGGIVAGVIVALLLVALLIFAIWFAKKKGYLPAKKESSSKMNASYHPPPSGAGDDADFTQKSSFVV